MYADKLRATDNADEILKASKNWVNEALLHPRADAIIDFARGEVQMRVGGNDYTAQVIVGNRGESGLVLYDIINLTPISIRERTKKADTDRFTTKAQSEPGGSRSVSAVNSVAKTAPDVKRENADFPFAEENKDGETRFSSSVPPKTVISTKKLTEIEI